MKHLTGYLMVAAAAVFWGLSGTVAKILLSQDVDTVLLVQMRATFSAAIMAGVLIVTRPLLLRLRVRDMGKLLLFGIAGIAGANFTYYFAIKEGTVATGILLQYTAPLLVMGYAAWTREEELTVTKLMAAMIAVAGCFLAIGRGDAATRGITPVGIASGIASAFCFGFLTVYTRHLLQRYSAWTVTAYGLIAAAVFWSGINPPWKIAAENPPPLLWLQMAGFAMMSVLIPYSLYIGGLRHIVASRAIIVSTLEPVVAIASAALMVGEDLSLLQTLGAALVLAAIMLLQIRREPGGEELPEGMDAS